MTRPVIAVRDLWVSYQRVWALSGVSLEIEAGAFLRLTGPSGCGKSTLARCMAGWQNPDSGTVERFSEVQLVMQDPGASLNPRFTAYEIVEEPLWLAGRVADIHNLLEQVGIPAAQSGKKSGDFSGGERARLAIARALAALPSGGLLILDESLAALDRTTRADILRLLEKLRSGRGVTILLIGHDVENASIIMESGKILCAG